MELSRIAELLHPFVAKPLEAAQLHSISMYLDLLLRWNARLNLTAVRDAESIVTRHMGESLFAAIHLLGERPVPGHAIDVGSGAGFPGLPFKIYARELQLTLIESHQKKATFLREVSRALGMSETRVFSARAEEFPGCADIVTLRAVERFERVLPVAASLVRSDTLEGARLALLLGMAQAEAARQILPEFKWEKPLRIPQSESRILLVGVPQSSRTRVVKSGT